MGVGSVASARIPGPSCDRIDRLNAKMETSTATSVRRSVAYALGSGERPLLMVDRAAVIHAERDERFERLERLGLVLLARPPQNEHASDLLHGVSAGAIAQDGRQLVATLAIGTRQLD